MKYFSIKELTASAKATQLGIKNEPSKQTLVNLESLVLNILDPLRIAWGGGIIVTSGYRSVALNKAVGGSPSSAHRYGLAADIVPLNGKIAEFKAFCRDYFGNRRHLFDQVILEDNGKSEWVHVGLKTADGRKRGQLIEYKNNRYTYL